MEFERNLAELAFALFLGNELERQRRCLLVYRTVDARRRRDHHLLQPDRFRSGRRRHHRADRHVRGVHVRRDQRLRRSRRTTRPSLVALNRTARRPTRRRSGGDDDVADSLHRHHLDTADRGRSGTAGVRRTDQRGRRRTRANPRIGQRRRRRECRLLVGRPYGDRQAVGHAVTDLHARCRHGGVDHRPGPGDGPLEPSRAHSVPKAQRFDRTSRSPSTTSDFVSDFDLCVQLADQTIAMTDWLAESRTS